MLPTILPTHTTRAQFRIRCCKSELLATAIILCFTLLVGGPMLLYQLLRVPLEGLQRTLPSPHSAVTFFSGPTSPRCRQVSVPLRIYVASGCCSSGFALALTAPARAFFMLVILYVHPGKWLQSGRPSTLVGVIPCSSRNTAVLLGRKKMW